MLQSDEILLDMRTGLWVAKVTFSQNKPRDFVCELLIFGRWALEAIRTRDAVAAVKTTGSSKALPV